MYRLKVVGGPGKGKSYSLQSGENSIGRQAGNVIHLKSTRVSKVHCLIFVNDQEVRIEDQSSTNGTFVNGTLTRDRDLKPGDRISVGEFVLEVRRRKKSRRSKQGEAEIISLDKSSHLPMVREGDPLDFGEGSDVKPAEVVSEPVSEQIPTDLKGKVFWHFEKYVMGFFYKVNLKYEWKWIALAAFGFFLVLNLFISVRPLIEANRSIIVTESGKRARSLARQIVERNAPALAQRAETTAKIPNSISQEDGVTLALLTDLENRIIAPTHKLNQYFTIGDEATFALKVGKALKEGRESGIIKKVSDFSVVAIEPLKVLNKRLGRNVSIAMAIVAIDTSIGTPDAGTVGIIYSKTLIFTSLLCGLILLVLYRMTLRPFEVLNDDIDRFLKGDLNEVSEGFKNEDLKQLWEVVRSALERVSKEDSPRNEFSEIDNENAIEHILSSLKLVGDLTEFGIVFCNTEKRVQYLNSVFEEISGIRMEEAAEQELSSVGRDEAFCSLVEDLFNQLASQIGDLEVSEVFEFGGESYRVRAWNVGGAIPKGFLFVTIKEDQEM